MIKVEEIFDWLDCWRQLPAYQLERRADIFLPFIFLKSSLTNLRSLPNLSSPNSPIRIGEISENTKNNQSFKADYLVITENRYRFMLVELKTNQGSVRSSQNEYLTKAQKAGMQRLVDGVIRILSASKKKRKYQTLLGLLREAGLIEKSQSGCRNTTDSQIQIEVLYILPTKSDQNNASISFAEVAEIVFNHTDEFSQRFAHSLTLWAKSPDAT